MRGTLFLALAVLASPSFCGEPSKKTQDVGQETGTLISGIADAPPLTLSDPNKLIGDATLLITPDPFEKTVDREKRISSSPLNGQIFQCFIPADRVTVVPFPDEDLFVVRMDNAWSPWGTNPPVVTVHSLPGPPEEVQFVDRFGNASTKRKFRVSVLKILVTNWSKLRYGLIWTDDPKIPKQAMSLSLGIGFKKPAPELMERMKTGRLGIYLKFKIVHPGESRLIYSLSDPNLPGPYQIEENGVTVPAELEGLIVLSDDKKRLYGLWNRTAVPIEPKK